MRGDWRLAPQADIGPWCRIDDRRNRSRKGDDRVGMILSNVADEIVFGPGSQSETKNEQNRPWPDSLDACET